MALYLLKPILWNTRNYIGPSGVRASRESYPGQNGFGHEEWNNSPNMAFSEGKLRFRAFHTEGVKKAPVDEYAGQCFVMMIATHGGIQQLVGVAGNAMYLGDIKHEAERKRIAKMLDIKDLWRDAWALPGVKDRFQQDEASFRRRFSGELTWVPNWICPDEYFLWFSEPVTLNAQSILGSNWLPKMFSGYKALEHDEAATVMNSVPGDQRSKKWERLMDAMLSAPRERVPPSTGENDDAPATTRLMSILARVGQGSFRDALLAKWGGSCAVTGLTCPELLRASHVKPWSSSTRRERLDPCNGLLLAAHLDALFDKGLISFDDAGRMLLSSRLQSDERTHFGLPKGLRKKPDDSLSAYLAHHRDKLFVA
ncbi:HNH endonuclease [Roseateles sp.]|uniref:HNH endonuclease n=1 Tax=Roseateles sp. TaxID=1971397 RepID=UPI0039E79238